MNLADVLIEEEETSPNTSTASLTKALQGSSTETPEDNSDNDLPEKFRGKSKAQIVEMYSNAESRLGQLGNELGVQRQLTDRILGLKREEDLRANSGQAKPKTPVTVNELLDHPQETLERVIQDEVDRRLEPIKQQTQAANINAAQKEFARKHPDFQTTANDPAFVAWVKASPMRLRVAAAANNGDWTIADELFTEYEAAKDVSEVTEDPRVAIRKASLTSSGVAGGKSDSIDKARGKRYSRSALMKLRMEDPEAYYDEDFQQEVQSAYAEGRVV